jgi:hypothetical protein
MMHAAKLRRRTDFIWCGWSIKRLAFGAHAAVKSDWNGRPRLRCAEAYRGARRGYGAATEN